MRRKYLNMALALGALLPFSSCSNDPGEPEPLEIHLSSHVTGVDIETRAASTVQTGQVAKDQHVGVYFYDAASPATEYSGSYTKLNLDYTATDDNGTLAIGGKYYFPNDDNGIRVFAYAPYSAAWTMNGENTFTVEKNQSGETNYKKSDLMMGSAYGGTVVARTKAPIPVTLDHILSKVTVKLVATSGLSDVHIVDTVYIMNTVTTAKVTTEDNLWKKTETVGTTPTTVTAGIFEGTFSDCSAVIVPQTVAKDAKFIRVTTNTGGVWDYPLPEALTLEKGKEYVYTITIGLTGLNVNKVTVSDWGDAFGLGSAGTESGVTI